MRGRTLMLGLALALAGCARAPPDFAVENFGNWKTSVEKWHLPDKNKTQAIAELRKHGFDSIGPGLWGGKPQVIAVATQRISPACKNYWIVAVEIEGNDTVGVIREYSYSACDGF